MDQVPKRFKRELRQLAGVAYERELARELHGLREQFDRWQRGKLTPFELSDVLEYLAPEIRFSQGEIAQPEG